MNRLPRTHRFRLIWAALALWVGCSGGGSCGGCSGAGGCLQPLPNGFQGTKIDNSVTARITPEGFSYINANWSGILTQAGLTNPIPVPVPCSNISVGSGGHICDQNQNGSCGAGEQCNVSVRIVKLTLDPATAAADTGIIKAAAQLQINTGQMWLRTCAASLFGACLCTLRCSADFSSTRSGSQVDNFNADVVFTLDAQWGRILAFNVANVGGINTLESNDLSVNTSGFCSAIACGVLDIGFIKSWVVDQFVKPQLMGELQKAIDDARCRACGGTNPACPAGSTCGSGKCKDPAGKCVPLMLGVEGKADLAALTGSLGAASAGALDIYAVAGGAVSSTTGGPFTVGIIGGGEPDTAPEPMPALCVPAFPPPSDLTVPAPDFSTADGGYHVGLAVSQRYLNKLSWSIHQAGALCMNLSSAQVEVVNTGLFKAFLPSLGKLATVDGQDAPMMMVLRPRTVPAISIGEGTVDPVTKKPIDPLIKVLWPDLGIDLYAMLGERQVRLFSITVDVALPLSLIFEGCDLVTPAIGDIKQLVTNIRTADSEILAEDPAALAALIPSLLTFAEPMLGKALKPIALPAVGAFKLKVNEAKGIPPAATVGFEHLGLFAQLMPAGAACAVSAPRTLAFLKRSVLPGPKDLLPGATLPRVVAVLEVASLGEPGTPEFATRVDHGLWTTFVAASGGELEVSHPALWVPGHHLIEVRSRMAESIHGVSAPAGVSVTVDYSPPEVSLRVDREHGRLEVSARDFVSAPERLSYAYRVGSGAWSEYGPPRLVDLEAIEREGGVSVRVRDETGNVGEAAHRAPTVALRPEGEGVAFTGPACEGAQCASGCSSAGGAPGALLLAALGALLRRRRR
ncbi:MAG: MYXO-CTERM sorting domain-containing protein [Myxococcaceae bacterium]